MPKRVKKCVVVYEENLFSVFLRGDVWYADFKDTNTNKYSIRRSLKLRNSAGITRLQAEVAAERLIKEGVIGQILAKQGKKHSVYFEGFASGFFALDGKYHRIRKCESESVRESTLDAYARNLNNYILPFFRNYLIAEIRENDVLRFREYLLIDKKVDPQTAKNIFVNLRCILKAALKEGLLRSDPASDVKVKVPKKKRKIGEILTLPEVDHLLATQWTDERVKLATEVALNTGTRRGEVLALRWRDFDFNAVPTRVYVTKSWSPEYGFGPTKNNEERVAYLSAVTRAKILDYQKRCLCYGQNDLVFPSDVEGVRPIDTKFLDDHFHRAMHTIGIDEDQRKRRDLTFHKLRHRAVTTMHQMGLSPLSIRKIVGHFDDEIEFIYFHGDGSEVGLMIDKVFGLPSNEVPSFLHTIMRDEPPSESMNLVD